MFRWNLGNWGPEDLKPRQARLAAPQGRRQLAEPVLLPEPEPQLVQLLVQLLVPQPRAGHSPGRGPRYGRFRRSL